MRRRKKRRGEEDIIKPAIYRMNDTVMIFIGDCQIKVPAFLTEIVWRLYE